MKNEHLFPLFSSSSSSSSSISKLLSLLFSLLSIFLLSVIIYNFLLSFFNFINSFDILCDKNL